MPLCKQQKFGAVAAQPLRARLVVRGFPNLDNHKTRVAAGNRNNHKLPLWGVFKPQEVCLVAKKTNLKKVT